MHLIAAAMSFALWMLGLYVIMIVLATPVAVVLRICGVSDSWFKAKSISYYFMMTVIIVIACAGIIWILKVIGFDLWLVIKSIGTIIGCMWDIFWIPFSGLPLR